MAAVAYRPRDGTTTVLHGVVRDHLEEFLALAVRHGDGTGLPPFVEQELRRFLGCGVLAHGFGAMTSCTTSDTHGIVPRAGHHEILAAEAAHVAVLGARVLLVPPCHSLAPRYARRECTAARRAGGTARGVVRTRKRR